MAPNKKHPFNLVATAVLTLAPPLIHGAGFDLPDQDAFVIGRGMAFVATADNPSAIYFNPAGITQLKHSNLRLGVYGLDIDETYKSPAGNTYRNENQLHAVPQFFYTYGLEDLPLSFGLGVYSPYGLSSHWPQDTGFRTVATEGRITYETINPVVAWQIIPSLSVAAGLTVNYCDMDLRQGLFWPTQPYDGFDFKGDGWAAGYNLGLLWKPLEKISFGVSFRSPTSIDLKGNTTAYNNVVVPYPPPYTIPAFSHASAANANFSFPLNAIVGVSYRPTPKWNLEFNADYTDWDTLGTVTVKQSTPFPILPANVPLTLNWQSSWYYEFGATRYFDNGWHVSAGYIFNENSVPDAHYEPIVGDLDRHFLSIGTGFKGKQFDFDIAYQFGYGPTRTVSGSALSAAGQSADGQYDFISHAIAISVGWRF
jgi:long-chain fatty acid transport protein